MQPENNEQQQTTSDQGKSYPFRCIPEETVDIRIWTEIVVVLPLFCHHAPGFPYSNGMNARR